MRRWPSPVTQTGTSSAIPAPRERAAPTNSPARPSARARDRRRSPRARSRAGRGTTAWPPGSCKRRTAGASAQSRSRNLLRAGTLRHVHHLIAVIVVGRQEHLDVLVPHGGDDFLHMARRGRNAGLRLDVIEARDLELAREVVPLLV